MLTENIVAILIR